MSALTCRTSAGKGRLEVLPRFTTVRSSPTSTARREHAELIIPVPPRNRTRSPVTRQVSQTHPTTALRCPRPPCLDSGPMNEESEVDDANIIWIGGPAAAGKTTVSRLFAQKYGFIYYSVDARAFA